MNIVLLGAPGSGKGTQAKMLAEKYHFPHISTGDILRQAIRGNTPLGREAEGYIKAGDLVPDKVVLGIIEERLQEADCAEGALFDGFPRTIQQADGLESMLKKANRRLDLCLSLEVPDEHIVRRLSSRRICSVCGADYNMISNPPPADNRCVICGGEIVQRADDQETTIRNRLAVYRKQTSPLQEYYSGRGLLRIVDGDGSPSEIFAKLCRVIDDHSQKPAGN
ncbi:MAG: adenylate kinase [Candidatus Zixiibacteriota bacterium]|nr:MAG: adenylate kinase [candidate division Zixibacteria bacterium]